MSDLDGAVADSGPVASVEPVIAETPNPITVDNEDKSPKPEPKAEVKPETPRDALKRAAEKVASMDKPADKTAPIKDGGPTRADDGKFAPKEGDKAKAEPKVDAKPVDAKPTEAKDAAKPVADARATETRAPASEPAKAAEPAKTALSSHTAEEPPSRFSADAKRDWATAPESVRAEVSRAVKELTQGFEKHRAAAERDRDISEYHEMAQKGGTDLKTALSRYVGMENALRQDPLKGLEIVLRNVGLTPQQYAAQVLNQPQEQRQSQSDQTILALQRELAGLKEQVGGVTQTFERQRAETTQESVTKFASDPAHSRFEELADDIAFFLKTRCPGNLEEAYKLAERLNPATAAQAETSEVIPAASHAPAPAHKPIPVPDTSAQTEKGRKSIAGSPTPGSNPATKRPSNSIKDSLRKAFAQAG